MQAKQTCAGALLALLLAAPLLHADGFANPALKPSTPPLQDARVDGLDIDNGKISVTDCAQLRSTPDSRPICEGSAFDLSVDDEALRTKLRKIQLGDHIRINFNLPGNTEGKPPYKVTAIAGLSSPHISLYFRLGVLFGSFAITFLLGTILTFGHPLKLVMGADNRYSNSKLQAALWFWVLLTSYLQFLYIRVAAGGLDFLGGISIPQNLLLLSGMSALTFAGAKGITTAKANAYDDAQAAQLQQQQAQAAAPAVAAAAAAAAVEASDGDPEVVAVASGPGGTAAAAGPAGIGPGSGPMAAVIAGPEQAPIPKPRKKTTRPENEKRSLWKDLMQNDHGAFDFGDFQMVVVTMLAVGTYLLSVHHALGHVQLTTTTSLPDLDSTILSTFGIGQGAYLAKKAVGNASAS